ncbi:TPA: hypothetical protein ACH3X2_003655 [Trebouxia sp. C0005]
MLQAVRRTATQSLSKGPSQIAGNAQLVPTTNSSLAPQHSGSSRFDPAVLRFLVCPLTKGDLRYDAGKQELISEEIQVAYPIIDGIARLVPTAGRMMEAAEFPAS